jgi:branched-chain amino acid transport system ATP-binding protein
MLSLSRVTVRYGNIVGVRDLDLTVNAGEVVALLGPNGAGKSSTLNTIVGFVRNAAGEVTFEGQNIGALPVEQRVKLGLTLSPEGRRVFTSLTIAENLRMGARTRRPYPQETEERLLDMFPILSARYRESAGHLSGGEQQQLAIARALMSEPRLLLLDEPSLGLAPIFVDVVFSVLRRLRDEGMTILLVEQTVTRALELADRAYVLASGSVVQHGNADDLREAPELTAAYLGTNVAG